MEFTEMRNHLMANFNEMTKDVKHLYVVLLDKDKLWNLYLDSFPAGKNDIYRVRREYDCSCCRGFIKNMGNVVKIKDGVVSTIWGFRTDDDTYQPVLDALDSYVKSCAVSDVFISNADHFGTLENYETDVTGRVHKWEHFFLNIPQKFIVSRGRSTPDVQGDYRDIRNVFKRSLDEISMEALDTILELIASNTLYKGEENKSTLVLFRKYKIAYDKLATDEQRELFAWEFAPKAGAVVGKIRNHSIGTLLVNVSEGMDLDLAVRKYEQIVAPSNYKRPKEIFTKKMLEDARKTIEELGYMDSLGRRFATLDDITINNILFSNRDSAKRISGTMDVFDSMDRDISRKPKSFDRVEEVPIEKFVSDVLPTAKEIEAYVENRHSGNMVSLIAPQNKEAKSMFKWNNNFGWSYAGNVTDSMRERVKAAGGKVDGVLRFSIQWNEDGHDNCDLDAHCIDPGGHEIYFRTDKAPRRSSMGGQLDVDVISPCGNIAVENITWPDRSKMEPGTYKFLVNQYSGSARNGFRAEIEFDGQVYSFDYHNSMRAGQNVQVATVMLSPDGKFTIKEELPSNVTSKDVWGIKTNQFTPVTVMMYSPNYWDEQTGIGHKHYFFMLKDCINPENPNGFYNEFLKNELETHKRVFAALGSRMKVEDNPDQLSGIGFSATKRDELVVKVKGNTERVMKIKF